MDEMLDNSINYKDDGAETLKRYRFQITYSAIISLNMLSENVKVKEIFCEHYEDILLKLVNDKFVGVQVKTRDINLGPFCANDPPIEKSLVRFIELEKLFGNQFQHYTIVSNVGFKKSASNFDLQNIIKLAKEGNEDNLLKNRSKTKKWIEKIAKETHCKNYDIINILKKINLKGDAASIESIFNNLVAKIGKIESLNEQTLGTLEAIAESIIMKHFDASSLNHSENLNEYYVTSSNPEEDQIKEIIDSKKITCTIINTLIQDKISEPITLFIKNNSELGKIPTGERKLEVKMDRGGISYDNIVLQKDLKYSTEKQISSWIYKYNEEKANMKYNQVKLIVNNECQESYDENKNTLRFGQQMLIDVRKRLKKRFKEEKASFFDLKYEHLLGMVGILTEECKIWWSTKFKV